MQQRATSSRDKRICCNRKTAPMENRESRMRLVNFIEMHDVRKNKYKKERKLKEKIRFMHFFFEQSETCNHDMATSR